MPRPRRTAAPGPLHMAEAYNHYEAEAVARPEVGVQAQFRKKKPARKYRYDPSLDPELAWNEANVDQEVADLWDRAVNAETLEEAKAALQRLNQIAAPSLRWAGKAERPEFSVPTLPLFVHERLSTKAILETLQGHKRDRQMALDLFGDQQLPITDRVLKAYEHKDKWVNRMILGDSLQVMNSLLEYESMGGQVQMIYVDPPYGVKFGSNFQPFVRKRDVKNNDDGDMTREPEMVQAYRDTWELGLHSYLTYMRDRLQLARDLLHPTGSIFVQIGDQHVHKVREVLDELFGPENVMSQITFSKTTGSTESYLSAGADYLLWYARDKTRVKFNPIYLDKELGAAGATNYNRVLLPDGSRRYLTSTEKDDPSRLTPGARIYSLDNLTSQSLGRAKGEGAASWFPVELDGETFRPPITSRWKTNQQGMEALKQAGRLEGTKSRLGYVRFLDDFPVFALNNIWSDVAASFMADKFYAVQTAAKVIQRFMTLTTDPGDLVFDPTCGSGTTALTAELWGRRWITADVSRVPLALSRQRLLTATYPYFKLRDSQYGVAGGFEYCAAPESNNRKSDGYGVVEHIMLEDVAKGRLVQSEVLVDRPERDYAITRVSGPFAFEATIPTPVDLDGDGIDDAEPDAGSDAAAEVEDYFNRMFETLRKVRRIKLPGGADVEFGDIRLPTRSLVLSAEATVEDAPVGIVFGPENGAVSERLVFEAAREAYAKSMVDLYVLGFAIEPNARQLVEKCLDVTGVHANYVSVAPDVAMGDLLKNQRSSQVFSIAGLPDVRLIKDSDDKYRVQLLGLDTFDPATMETDNMRGEDVPAWFLDANYNAQGCFIVDQAFFPRTSAWDSLRRELRGTFEDSVWDALSGTISEPFEPGDTGQAAVKVIDDRGNELIVVKSISEAVPA